MNKRLASIMCLIALLAFYTVDMLANIASRFSVDPIRGIVFFDLSTMRLDFLYYSLLSGFIWKLIFPRLNVVSIISIGTSFVFLVILILPVFVTPQMWAYSAILPYILLIATVWIACVLFGEIISRVFDPAEKAKVS